eukprot:765957-Hanusia_phi.AAC.8
MSSLQDEQAPLADEHPIVNGKTLSQEHDHEIVYLFYHRKQLRLVVVSWTAIPQVILEPASRNSVSAIKST